MLPIRRVCPGLTALIQICEAGRALGYADAALNLSGNEAISGYASTAIWILPGIIHFVQTKKLVPQCMKPAVKFVQAHYGTLCNLAAFVSSIALIYFGSVPYGVTSLIVLGFGILDRNGLLPQQVAHLMHELSFPLMIFNGIFLGDGGSLISTGVNILCYVAFKSF